MELVTKDSLEEVKEFVISNMKRSAFMYGNLFNDKSETYVYRDGEQIIAAANIIDNMYCTYLFPENTSVEVAETVVSKMVNFKHIGGTVTGDYKELFSKYYSLPHNCENEVAALDNSLGDYKLNRESQYINDEHLEDYFQAISKIDEFNQDRGIEDYRRVLNTAEVAAIFENKQIIAAASLSAISDKSAVVTGVFTDPEFRLGGLATECVKRLLQDYAKGRTILIFFSNPIAKHVYLKLGFEVNDKLLMFDQPL